MDRLTQLQSAVDALATQFYSALAYLSGDSLFSEEEDENNNNKGTTTITQSGGASRTDTATPDATDNNEEKQKNMTKVQQELADDIISRAKQIDLLINALPGIGLSRSNQLDRVNQLQDDINLWTSKKDSDIDNHRSLLVGCDNLIIQLSLGLANVDSSTN